jgi:hypothetical protein
VVGEGCGEAVAQEDQRPHGDQAMIIDCTSRRCTCLVHFLPSLIL